MTTKTERAWAAGLFDGEGSTCVGGRSRPDGHRPSLRMTLSQKNTGPELLERFRQAVEHGRVSERSDRPGVWVWVCIGEPCKEVLNILWPYLSSPKKEQAAIVLAKQLACRQASKRPRKSWQL